MKGLLLKDWFMLKKYCKSYLFIAAAFMAASTLNNTYLFFVFYPCMLCGMLPVTLLAYDEKCNWLQYCGTLPYTKSQIVSAKYILGVLIQLILIVITAVLQAVKMNIDGSFNISDYSVLLMMLVFVAAISSSICLPFNFKYGVEKGRIMYYIMIGSVSALSILAADIYRIDMSSKILPNSFLPIICIIAILIYALSWYLSIVFYKKREL